MEENSAVETVNTKEVLAELGSQEFDSELFKKIALVAFGTEKAVEQLQDILNDWDTFAASLPTKEAGAILKGYCLLLNGDVDAAEELLKGQKRNPWGAYWLARTMLERNRTDEALNVAVDASEKNPDVVPLSFLVIEIYSRIGNTEAAAKLLEKLKRNEGDTADFHYHQGYLAERSGEYASAIQSYRQAAAEDSQHAEAFFRLGYLVDLYGTESDEANEEALSAYESCVRVSPVHTNAVVNLGLLYEDRERYHDAIKCYETVLRRNPNHARANLYLGDSQSSTSMFYDKEQEKKADKQSQVLKIPISDFELSVRSRNCLQKMNIATLGDLILKSEQELLSYKNFGETSLTEIKEMLSQKGLRLGQGLEQRNPDVPAGRNPLEATAAPDVLVKPIEELNLSVRSRRCMERLGVHNLCDLINKTEVELMSAKNFGMTSLNEIKRKLAELGLSLRS